MNKLPYLLLCVCETCHEEMNLSEALLMSTKNIYFHGEIRKKYQKFSVEKNALSGAYDVLTMVLLNPDMPWLFKQCRSRSLGF